jgi:threonine synthase
MWRYTELLPFPSDFSRVTMREGWTPLLRAIGLERELEHGNDSRSQAGIWIKDERRQPTGSFKDRQATFTVSALKAQGVDELVLASTGNAAAAYSAYCARAGIKLWAFLTSSVPAEKMRELALYGAEVVKVTGTYDQAKEIAADFAARRNVTYDKGAKAIPGKESMKTIALEIAEQMEWQAPDWYVQAVSGGIGPLGVLKGFEELYQAGLIDRVPKIAVVQAEGCSPMVQAWEKGLAQADPVQPDTLITVLSTGKPGLAYEILKKANDQYGGAMVSVSDGETFRAMRRVARVEGFSVEPAASVAFAGLEKLFAADYVQPNDRIVVNCSGHTFSAEKHALEDRYVLHLNTGIPNTATAPPDGVKSPSQEGLAAALEKLDEQITTIAVIEDNPHDSRLIRRLLQSYKRYRVFEAYTGRDGLDLVRQRQPDLVVLDLTLPDTDGFTILDELKSSERTREIPVVIISAKALTAQEQTYLQRHTDSIWQKGNFSARELVNHVVQMLGDLDSDKTSGSRRTALAQPPSSDKATGTGQMDLADEAVLGDFGREQRPRILVIDDYVADARLIRRLFESRQRFEVIEAHTGTEAMDTIQEAPPDLIILDLILPDINGEQILDILQEGEDTRDIPVVVVSAKELDHSLRAKLAMQTDSVWSKGMLDRSNLLAHVETILTE